MAWEPVPPFFWVKKEEMTEGRKASMASKTKPGPYLAQGLDPPMITVEPCPTTGQPSTLLLRPSALFWP